MFAATQHPLIERRHTAWCPSLAQSREPNHGQNLGQHQNLGQNQAANLAPRPVTAVAPVALPAFAPSPVVDLTPDLSHESRALRLIIEQTVGYGFDLEPELLSFPSRGRARIALARQVSMYLAHVCLSFSLTQVGQLFERDRTTVAHACEVVEQRRDNQAFDLAITLLERVIRIMCGAPGRRPGVTTPLPISVTTPLPISVTTPLPTSVTTPLTITVTSPPPATPSNASRRMD
jgi:Bacterial dnaA protein helix-turn-helix